MLNVLCATKSSGNLQGGCHLESDNEQSRPRCSSSVSVDSLKVPLYHMAGGCRAVAALQHSELTASLVQVIVAGTGAEETTTARAVSPFFYCSEP